MFENIIRALLSFGDNDLSQNICNSLLKIQLKSVEKGLCKEILSCIESGATPKLDNFLSKYYGSVFTDSYSSLSKDALYSEVSLLSVERKNLQMAKELSLIANKITEEGYDEALHRKLSEVVSGAITVREESYEDPLRDVASIYAAKKEQGSGLSFGVDVIDKAIGGIQPGSFNTIFAYTGSYKTLSAVNIAYNNSFNKDFNICYISLEVVKSDLMWNIYSRHSFEMHSSKFQYLPHDKIRNAALTEKEEAFLFNDVVPDYESKKKGHLYLLDESDFDNLSFIGFEKRLREIENLSIKETGKGIDCVIVDQAQLLKYGAKDSIGNEGNVINAWVSFFRQQCLSFLGTNRPIAVIMLSQANREGWRRAVKNEGRYDLRAISEANELERASWRIFSIFTDENMKESKEAKVQCLKNRTGLTVMDPVVVFVDPVCYTFGDVGSGYNDTLSVESLDDIFSSEFDDSLFG